MAVGSAERLTDDGTVRSPTDVLSEAFARHGADRVAISFSGAEDVILIDMAVRLGVRPQVFSLDTGRLHAETYRFLETVRERYDLALEVLTPNADAVADLVKRKGLFSFYRDGHQECCAIRKIEPLKRKLSSLDAWITGQRRDQSATRTAVPFVQPDIAFSRPDHSITKYNPLAHWSSAEVWQYIRTHDVPYNPLHDHGFASIGCEPCTRPVGPHEHERNGRWWWEQADGKECGLHAQNIRPVRIVG